MSAEEPGEPSGDDKIEWWTLFAHLPVHVETQGNQTRAVFLDENRRPVPEFSVTLEGKGEDVRRRAVELIGMRVHQAAVGSVRP